MTSLAFSLDGKRLASGSYDKTLRLWDLQRGKCIKVLEKHAQAITSIALSPNGLYLASVSWDQTLQLWDATSGAALASATSTSDVNSCSWHPDDQHIATAHKDESVRYWRLKFLSSSAKKTIAHLQLVWTSKQKTLSLTGCDISNTRRLSANNAALLVQRGATESAANNLRAPRGKTGTFPNPTPATKQKPREDADQKMEPRRESKDKETNCVIV